MIHLIFPGILSVSDAEFPTAFPVLEMDQKLRSSALFLQNPTWIFPPAITGELQLPMKTGSKILNGLKTGIIIFCWTGEIILIQEMKSILADFCSAQPIIIPSYTTPKLSRKIRSCSGCRWQANWDLCLWMGPGCGLGGKS